MLIDSDLEKDLNDADWMVCPVHGTRHPRGYPCLNCVAGHSRKEVLKARKEPVISINQAKT